MKMTLAKLLVLAALVSLAQAPAHAAAPTIRESSIENGWSTDDRAVAARYTSTLEPTRSTAAVRDARGEPIEGWSDVNGSVITFRSGEPMQGEHGPFQVTFTVMSVWQRADETPATDTISFEVDPFHPRPPVLDLPETTVSVPDSLNWSPGYISLLRVAITDPTQPFTIQGIAREAGEERIREWSGIAAMELKIFRPDGRESAGQRRKVLVDCSAGCPFEHAFTMPVEDLEPGFWTARVASYDLAGNRSSDSESVSFVVAA